mmetsp:Transcript_39703/g.28689  ORF Transcript_39703/g.28689 Transcript_39703/m.28689 type:complete len:84 (+) Transcript_39703:715-966(+)
MILTLIIGIGMYVIVFFRTRDDASVFTSSLVLSYHLYLQWSALASDDDETCNPYFDGTSSATTMQVILGLFFTILSLFVIAAS